MITAREFRNGIFVEIAGGLFLVLETEHVKRQNRRALVRTKLRNLQTGVISESSFRSEEAFEQAFIEQKTVQYIYHDDSLYYFMDQATYEQNGIKKEVVGDCAKFLKDGIEVTVSIYKEKIVGIALPPFIELKVTYTEPGIKGDTAKSGSKPATLETGAVITVPLFVNADDIIKVDTRTGDYSGRA